MVGILFLRGEFYTHDGHRMIIMPYGSDGRPPVAIFDACCDGDQL
jgi:hypothetical protein